MVVHFEMKVSFIEYPSDALEGNSWYCCNCLKCPFYGLVKNDLCAHKDTTKCEYGAKGYYALERALKETYVEQE